MNKVIATAIFLFLAPIRASAQDSNHQYHGQGYGVYGIGTVVSSLFLPYSRPVAHQIGFGGERFLSRKLGAGGELSYVYWGVNDNQSWVPAANVSYHFRGNTARARLDPFALGGIAVYVPAAPGNRGDPAGVFGGGFNYWIRPHFALRFELRTSVNGGEYKFGPGNPYFSFRFGVTMR